MVISVIFEPYISFKNANFDFLDSFIIPLLIITLLVFKLIMPLTFLGNIFLFGDIIPKFPGINDGINPPCVCPERTRSILSNFFIFL